MNHGIQGGRSFFLPSTGRRYYLGDCYELWLGLFQSLCLGKIPLINVDVNHKAFPKRYNSLIDMLRDMERDEQDKRAKGRNQGGPPFRIDLNRPLDRFILNAVESFLKGLDICYTNTKTGVQRIYKFMSIERSPDQVTFSLENGQQTTVLKYFQNTGRKIQYPALPCIKIGNSLKNQIIPMEYCSIFDKQVKQRSKCCVGNILLNKISISFFISGRQ